MDFIKKLTRIGYLPFISEMEPNYDDITNLTRIIQIIEMNFYKMPLMIFLHSYAGITYHAIYPQRYSTI